MERIVTDRNILDTFCEAFCAVIEKHAKYIIVSGFLAIASGRTRGTEDIDMILERLSAEKWTALFFALQKAGFVCMQTNDATEAYDYLKDSLSLRFTMKEQPLPEMEVKFAKDALDEQQLRTRVKLSLTGLDVWFGDVNMTIAFKEELLKSPKDLEDAKHLRIVFKELVTTEKIETSKKMIRAFRL